MALVTPVRTVIPVFGHLVRMSATTNRRRSPAGHHLIEYGPANAFPQPTCGNYCSGQSSLILGGKADAPTKTLIH